MKDIMELAAEFAACQKILTALGDETRQHLIMAMNQLLQMLTHAKAIMENLPDRSGEKE